MKQDPAPDVKCRDKFLVQSVPISSELEFSNVQTIVSPAMSRSPQIRC